jgi:hypothetical protein
MFRPDIKMVIVADMPVGKHLRIELLSRSGVSNCAIYEQYEGRLPIAFAVLSSSAQTRLSKFSFSYLNQLHFKGTWGTNRDTGKRWDKPDWSWE